MRQFLKSMPMLSAIGIGFGVLLIILGLIFQQGKPPYMAAVGSFFVIAGVASALPVDRITLKTISRVLQALLLLGAILYILVFAR